MKFNRSSIAFLTFGFLTAFLSGPGQTYVISIFNPIFQQELDLGSGFLGTLYAVATLGSAFCLPLMGRLIDRVGLVPLTTSIIFGLAGGAILLGVAESLWLVVIAFFMLRFFGQGSMSILGRTVISKFYRSNRGKALAIQGMGHPAAEVIMPGAVIFAMTIFPWRQVWYVVGGFIVLVFLPLLLICLRQMYRVKPHELERSAREAGATQPVSHGLHAQRSWQVGEALRDIRLHLFLPASLFPPFVLTGLIFQHHIFIEAKGWSLEFVAQAFFAYGLAHAVFGILSGPFVDRFSAQRIISFYLIPLILGLLVLLLAKAEYMVFLYLSLCGATVGMGHTIKPALWAEMYGTKNIGAVSSSLSSIMVFSTAAAPPIFGYALEFGVRPEQLLWGIVFFGLLATALMVLAMRISISRSASSQKRDRPGLVL